MNRLTEPLRFERVHVEKTVWGGRSLEGVLGIDLPEGMKVGETWELVDRADVNSLVVGGSFDGWTLERLMAEHAGDLLGSARPTAEGRFPLLVKFLDAAEHLSVQVHPDDAGARAQGGGSEPKTEAWYFLASSTEGAPSGGVWCGLRPGSTREAVEAALGTPGIVQHLAWWPVSRGQALMVPGGTIHAIAAGVQLLEVQQNSDTTWRIYDWDRVDSATGKPRDQHVPQAAEVTRYDLGPRPPVDEVYLDLSPGAEAAPLARCRHFRMDRLRISAPADFDTDGKFQIYVVVEGSGALVSSSDERGANSVHARTELVCGDTLLVPAACGGHRIEPSGDRPLGIVQLSANT